MPHPRERYARPILKQLMTHSPIVGILGQRQTGKTTLTEANSAEYSTLDLKSSLEMAEENPEQFLRNREHPFTIDECQMAPSLFPALKERVRVHPRKGQFILTGSVRFTSRKAIRESLTGRIVNLELLPFSLAESNSEPLPRTIIQWIRSRVFPDLPSLSVRWLEKTNDRFNQFLMTGGLPGICFYRDKHIRTPRFETHLETLLERDIRLLVNTTIGYRQLRLLCSQIAISQGQALNYSELAKRVGFSPPSIKKYISALEAMFLVRTFSSDNQASPVIFFEDQGLASHLMGDQSNRERDLVRGLFSNLLPQFLYRPEMTASFSQYRTRGGAKVDIVIRTEFGTMGIIPVTTEGATQSAIASARSFLVKTSGSKVIIAHQGNTISRISETLIAVPFQLLISDSWT